MSEGTANQFWKPQVFFQQLYSKKSTNNKFCYGMGHSHPSVPFIFETLENDSFKNWECFQDGIQEPQTENRRREEMKELIDDFVSEIISKEGGHKYICKLDSCIFHSESTVITHIRNCHRQEIEDILKILGEDMEQFHLGNFFTKLFYPNLLYPFHKSGHPSNHFPTVLAPELPALEKTKSQRKEKDGLEGINSVRKDRKIILAKNIFSPEELIEMEKRIYLSGNEKESNSNQLELNNNRKTSVNIKVQNTMKSSPPTNISSESQSSVDVDKLTPKNLFSARSTDKSESQGTENLTSMLNETLDEKFRDAIKIDRKLRKQIEDELAEDLLSEVILDFCNKLGPKTLQEVKKAEAKEKEEAKLKEKADEEAKKEALSIVEREQKLQERKIRREIRKQEGDRVADEIIVEVLNEEFQKIFKETKKELNSKNAKNPTSSVQEVKNIVSKDPAELNHSTENNNNLPNGFTRTETLQEQTLFSPVSSNWNSPSILPFNSPFFFNTSQTTLERPSVPVLNIPSNPLPINPIPIIPLNVTPPNLTSNPIPPNLNIIPSPNIVGNSAPNSYLYSPFSQQKPLFDKSPSGNELNMNGQPLSSFSIPNSNSSFSHPPVPLSQLQGPSGLSPALSPPLPSFSETLIGLNQSIDYPIVEPSELLPDYEEDESTSSGLLYDSLSSKDNIFGSPYFLNSLPKNNQDQFRNQNTLSSVSNNSSLSSTKPPSKYIPTIVEKGTETISSDVRIKEAPSPANGIENFISLQSIPEDYGLNSKLCVVCQNLVPSIRRGEIGAFFRDCNIALDKDQSLKIQFLKGVDSGCCFVEFQTQQDLKRALEKNGKKVGEVVLTVARSSGALVSESGQKFIFNVSTRNVPGAPKSENENRPSISKSSELNHMAPEFKPSKNPLSHSEDVSTKKHHQTKTHLNGKEVGNNEKSRNSMHVLEPTNFNRGKTNGNFRTLFPVQSQSHSHFSNNKFNKVLQ